MSQSRRCPAAMRCGAHLLFLPGAARQYFNTIVNLFHNRQYGLRLSSVPGSVARWASRGMQVTYTLLVTNTGNLTNSFVTAVGAA